MTGKHLREARSWQMWNIILSITEDALRVES